VKPTDVCRRIERLGGEYLYTRGSHRWYEIGYGNGGRVRTYVAIHSRDVPKGTLRAIERGPRTGAREGMAAAMTYLVVVEREDAWWLSDVPQLQGVHTYGRDLIDLDMYTREVIALAEQLPEGREVEAALDLTWQFRTGGAEFDALATRLCGERSAVDVPDERTRAVAADLGARGYAVRDIAWLLVVSPRRVGRWVPRAVRGTARAAH
jgi:predicted RNA binding protein YcfA (HicA-like mRNA interferase family)